MLRQRQALHGEASWPDLNRPLAHMNLTLWVFPFKAQQQATGRLQVDPD
jgi:hypothetical protein